MNRFIQLMCCIIFVSLQILVKADCDKECDLPINIYEQLKCTPKYEQSTDCCPKEYDCSNIFKRPEKTCHLRGKLYKVGEYVTPEEIAENCHVNCQCIDSLEFRCIPIQKDCREYYVFDYPKTGCYLRYPLDSCCASNEVCPPFDNITKCVVNGKTYREGERFMHPERKCTKCVCTAGFDGKFSEPACQHKNCTTEIKYSKKIDQYCAPFYSGGNCCPIWWICPATNGKYIPAPKVEKPELQCKFGEKMMDIGSKYRYQDEHTEKLVCECVVPPLLSCFKDE